MYYSNVMSDSRGHVELNWLKSVLWKQPHPVFSDLSDHQSATAELKPLRLLHCHSEPGAGPRSRLHETCSTNVCWRFLTDLSSTVTAGKRRQETQGHGVAALMSHMRLSRWKRGNMRSSLKQGSLSGTMS